MALIATSPCFFSTSREDLLGQPVPLNYISFWEEFFPNAHNRHLYLSWGHRALLTVYEAFLKHRSSEQFGIFVLMFQQHIAGNVIVRNILINIAYNSRFCWLLEKRSTKSICQCDILHYQIHWSSVWKTSLTFQDLTEDQIQSMISGI